MARKMKFVALTLTGLLMVITMVMYSLVTSGAAHAQRASQGSFSPRYTYMPLHTLGSNQALSVQAARAVNGLPTWSSSFSFNNQNYNYTMVGTDPHTSSATTTIPVDIVPLIFKFSDGTTSDGTTITDKIVASPMFQNATYNTGDNTQYVDAVQRAEFWSSVSTKTKDYHVLLGKPTVQQAVTLTVPSASGSTNKAKGVGQVDINWFSPQADKLAVGNGLSAQHLTIFAAVNINMYQGTVDQCCIGGYHTAVQNGGSNYTYAYADYDQTGSVFQDVAALSHELAEWANDPLTNNTVPNWSVPSEPQYGCNRALEVGDPLVGKTFAVGSYHVQDEASFSWFAHETTSQAFQGKYSFQGNFTSPATTC